MRIRDANDEIILGEVIEDNFDFDLLDLKTILPRFEGLPELSFQDGEHGFNFVSLMIFFLIERLSDSSSIISGDSFTFSVSDRDKRTRVERVLD
jgi:hypothetical protein